MRNCQVGPLAADVMVTSMVEVPASFRSMPRWWDDERGRAWLEDLPALVAAQCAKWDLVEDGAPLHGSNALVVPVRKEGEAFALRLAPPGDHIRDEVHALRVWAGRGTVQLIDADEPTRAVLLERLHRRSLEDEPLESAIPILGELTRALAVPVDTEVRSTATVAAVDAAEFEQRWQALDRPAPRSQLLLAVALAEERAAAIASNRAVNGDLHFEQVLAGDRAPWIVVDPVLLRGDAEYDIGRVLWSRLDELPLDEDVFDAFDQFVAASGTPSGRGRAWVVIRSMSYLLWGMERGLTWDPPKCSRLLDLFC